MEAFDRENNIVIDEAYVDWFIDFMTRKGGYYDFENRKQISPNWDTPYTDKIDAFFSLIDGYMVKHEIEPKSSYFFPRAYRVAYSAYDIDGNEQAFKFLIHSGDYGVSACSDPKQDYTLNAEDFVSLNAIFEENKKDINGYSKTKNTKQ